jgi:Zn-dependent M28 family amino/carboxypeptidase
VAAAATRYRVNARAAEGFTDYRRAGIAWPRGAGKYREVLVVDQAADPPGQQLEGELAIGRKTFEILRADPEIFADSANSAAADDAEKVALKARITELEGLLAQATEPGKGADGKSGKGK